MTAAQVALAAVIGAVVYTVAVATPLAVLIGRAIRRAEAQEEHRRAVEAAQDRHPSGRHLRSVAL